MLLYHVCSCHGRLQRADKPPRHRRGLAAGWPGQPSSSAQAPGRRMWPGDQERGLSLAGSRPGACAAGRCQAVSPSSAVGWLELAVSRSALRVRKKVEKNTCCKRMFQVFQMFQRYVASVSDEYCKSRSGCFICCNPNISFVFSNVCLSGCYICFHTYVPSCKFFLWLLLQDRLWTSQRLQLRGWPNNYFCALCERNLETALHLFFECHVAGKIWTLVAS
jgi:hypothetical protein